MAELAIRRILLFLVGIMLIMAGLNGHLGSMLASLIDTQAMTTGNNPYVAVPLV